MYAGIEPNENAALREKIDESHEMYLQIPGRDHCKHHDILQDFLKSKWTDDEELWIRARDDKGSDLRLTLACDKGLIIKFIY